MKTTFEHIPKIIREDGLECFTVSTSKTGNSYVFKSDDDKDIETNIEDLRARMSVCYGEYFVLQGKRNKNANREVFTFEFSNREGATPQYVAGVGGANVGYTEDFVQQKIDVAIGKVKYEIMEADLKKREQEFLAEKREFDRRKEDAIEIGLQHLGKHLPTMFGKGNIRPHPAAQPQHYSNVAGTEVPTEIKILENDELEEKTRDLLQRWSEADADWLILLEKIVDFASNGKTINAGLVEIDYDKVKQMIIENL